MTTNLKKMLLGLLSLALLTAAGGMASAAEDWSKLNPGKKTKLELYITPAQAQEAKQANPDKTLFVDIRTPEELTYLGTATTVDANVPFQFIDTKKWDEKGKNYATYDNKNFVADIEAVMKKKGLGKDDTIILMCRSGHRSANGVNALAAAGYTKVYNQVEGFEGDKAKDGPTKGQRTVNGWKNAGLPWTYKLSDDLSYVAK